MENIIKVATSSTEAKELINNYVAPTPVEVQIAQEARKARKAKPKMNKAKFAERTEKMKEIFKANNGVRKATIYSFVEAFDMHEGTASISFYKIKKLLAK